MTAVIVSALVVCLVLVVVLVVVVRRLQASVETLSRQVQANASTAPAASMASGRRPASGATPLRPASAPSESLGGAARAGDESAEAVVSITDVSTQPRDHFNVTRVASVTLARPLLKAAALSYGLRRALDTDSRLRIAHAMRKELKQQQKLRRRRAAHRAPSQEWKS